MKVLLGVFTAAAVLVGIAATQPAEARCFWNGVAWECWQYPVDLGWSEYPPWNWEKRVYWPGYWDWARKFSPGD